MPSPNKTDREGASRRRVVVTVALLALVIATAAGKANPEEDRTTALVDQLRSQDARTRDATVAAILRARTATVEKLIRLVNPANTGEYTNDTRAAAAYLLGKLRAVEAVPVLSQTLADLPQPVFGSAVKRSFAPMTVALIEIGRPAAPAMIENVETSDQLIVRKKSLSVLYYVVGGQRRLFELLTELEKRADDKEIRRRIGECITWSREHYKESKEPLY